MKINFSKTDNLYKIFKTIEKLPSGKEVTIYINEDNSLFDNIWLGKQVLDLLKSRNVNYVFLSKSKKSSKFLKEIGANFISKEKSGIFKFLGVIKSTFLDSKKIHSSLISQKSSLGYFIIFIEIFLVLFTFYYLYGFVTPSAQIWIKPSYSIQDVTYNFRYVPKENISEFSQIGQILIPYHKAKEKIVHEVSMSVNNIKYGQRNASGRITLYNTTSNSFSLVPNTRIVTIDGLVFRTSNWVNIPAGTEDIPGTVKVDVVADTFDESGNIIGERGNLPKDTRLYVRNLSESYNSRRVYGIIDTGFSGGETLTEGIVEEIDIEAVDEYLRNFVSNNLLSFAESYIDESESIIIPFPSLFSNEVIDVYTKQNIGDLVSRIDGVIEFELSFIYVNWSDINDAAMQYIKDRTSESYSLVSVNRNSLIFYPLTDVGNHYIIPTKVDVIWGYDFNNDKNSLIQEFKSLILGQTIGKAQELILSYDEADAVLIRVTPPWYEFIPSIRSRIDIIIKD